MCGSKNNDILCKYGNIVRVKFKEEFPFIGIQNVVGRPNTKSMQCVMGRGSINSAKKNQSVWLDNKRLKNTIT